MNSPPNTINTGTHKFISHHRSTNTNSNPKSKLDKPISFKSLVPNKLYLTPTTNTTKKYNRSLTQTNRLYNEQQHTTLTETNVIVYLYRRSLYRYTITLLLH